MMNEVAERGMWYLTVHVQEDPFGIRCHIDNKKMTSQEVLNKIRFYVEQVEVPVQITLDRGKKGRR
jgi:hypothetical protein